MITNDIVIYGIWGCYLINNCTFPTNNYITVGANSPHYIISIMKTKYFILTATIFYLFFNFAEDKRVNSYQINKQSPSSYELSPNLIITPSNLEKIAQRLAHDYLNKIPAQAINANLNIKEAQKIQNQFLKILAANLGKKIGYKAGLTNKVAQKKFGVSHPLSGVLLEKMLLNNGAIIPSNFGTRTILEGDLMVRVKNEEINQAKTPAETLTYLDAVIPFVELPDLVYGQNVLPTASELVAINVGARLGVMGKPIIINSSEEWRDKLANIEIIIKDENNQPLAVGNSRNLLGDPLKVVFWLKNSLNQQGIILKKGDLLSLGTITPMIPIKANMLITAEYLGLNPDNPKIKITFK
jgi:2-keto-4-pentenoate hydratase